MMLSLDTAYRSFGGEVEASSTPTICRLPDSRRHQLSAIALDEWQWTLSIGNRAPIEIGVVKGSRMDGIRAAREEQLRLIGKAMEATRMTHPKRPKGTG